MSNSSVAKPKLVIVHDHAESVDECRPGEEAAMAFLDFRGKRHWVPWGPTHALLADFLARRRIALDAWQISAKIREDPFVQQHATNAPSCHERPARTSRTAVRQQIRRMRDVLGQLIKEEGLDLDANEIIKSEVTSTRVVRYRITIDVIWEHWPRPNGSETISDPRMPKIPPALLGSNNCIRPEHWL